MISFNPHPHNAEECPDWHTIDFHGKSYTFRSSHERIRNYSLTAFSSSSLIKLFSRPKISNETGYARGNQVFNCAINTGCPVHLPGFARDYCPSNNCRRQIRSRLSTSAPDDTLGEKMPNFGRGNTVVFAHNDDAVDDLYPYANDMAHKILQFCKAHTFEPNSPASISFQLNPDGSIDDVAVILETVLLCRLGMVLRRV